MVGLRPERPVPPYTQSRQKTILPNASSASEESAVGITRLSHVLDDDFPTIDWSLHAPMADVWLEIDERHKLGQPVEDLLDRISYHLLLNRRWPRVDCVEMVPGLAVSERAKAAMEALGVPGMQFLGFRVNGEPFFLFYTERRVDCLDRDRSEIEYFRSSPEQVMQVVRYAFAEERVRSCDVFTVPELSDGMFLWSQETFVTDAVRTILEGADLNGFRFESLPGPSRQ
jgi:hypothetical protein